MTRRPSVRRFVVGALLLASACTRDSITAVVISTVSVMPPSVTTQEGEQVRFAAVVRDSEQGSLDGADVAWSSADESIVSIDRDGLARAVAPGTTRVRATFRDVTGEAVITVVSEGSWLDKLLPLDPIFAAGKASGSVEGEHVRRIRVVSNGPTA